jgi:UDP-glucose 4-epimerase
MKIVITGALGHIGSKLIRDLPNSFRDCEIVMIDDMSTQRYCSLFNLPDGVKYRFLEADIMKADLAPVVDGADCVIHLAAITNAEGTFNIADQVHRVNLDGTRLVAEACAKQGVPMLFVSTTSVYGSQAEVVDETCPISDLKPQSPYAESKLKAEQMMEQMGREAGLKYLNLRFGTIFGVSPGMRFHTAVNKFCYQAATGIPVSVWKTALNQRRPYLDLKDGVSALVHIMQKKLYNNTLYNVVSSNYTVEQILETIRKTAPELKINFVESKIMNQLSYCVESKKFGATGFTFSPNIQQQVGDTVRMFASVRTYGAP